MKKLLYVLPVLVFTMFSSVAFAQLNGVYTIGGTSPNYASFTAAVNALLASGVSGPVVFNARAGTYTESAITITAIAGASASNTIVFQSESGLNTDVILQTGITINAASYITLNNLTMGPAGIVINLVGKSNNITISNNIINGDVVTSFGEDVIQAIGFTGANLVICSNIINNGSEGICLYGTDNTPVNIIVNAIIKNNIIQNFYGWGITANFQRGTLIEGNTITTAPTSGYGSIPLYIQNIVYPITVIKNKISLTGSISGIAAMYIVNNHPDSLSEGSVIANNMISVQNGNGLELINNDYFSFYYNTVYNISSGTCFNVYGSSTGNVLADNIFYEGNGQTAISGSQPDIASSDYNDIYSTGMTLSSWQGTSGLDAHSQSIAPSFVSATNLDLTNFPPMQFGIAIHSIPDDINGDTRSSTPAVGADDNGPPYAPDTNTCCSCSTPVVSPPTAAFSASPISVCAGDSVLFTAQQGTGISAWKWAFSGATPATSTMQNPKVAYDTAGTYNVTLIVTGTGGADTLTKSAYITVNPSPVTGIVTANPDSICSGSSSLLTLTGSSGTIQWQSSGNGVPFSNIPSASAPAYSTPALTQTTYYRVDVSNSCGTDSSLAAVVFVTPVPVSGVLTAQPDTVCYGSAVRLSSIGISASIIQWQSANAGNSYSNISGADTVIYNTPSLTQSADYRVVVNNGVCADTSSPVYVTVNPSPVAPNLTTSDSIICSSDSARIQASGPYASYRWNDGDTTSYTYVNSAGDSWVTVSDANGCSAVSGHQAISVYPTPSVSIIEQGDTLSSFGATTYQWYLNGDSIPGAINPVYIAIQSGNYSVAITDTNGCKALSNSTYVDITGISQIGKGGSLTIYPDPFINTIFIKEDGAGEIVRNIKIYDVLGSIIVNNKYNDRVPLILPVDVSALSPGAYYIRVETNQSRYVRSIIKD